MSRSAVGLTLVQYAAAAVRGYRMAPSSARRLCMVTGQHGSVQAQTTTKRILCLHGGGTNEAIMRIQTAKLRAQLRGEFDFEFLEGTHTVEAVDPAIKKRFAGQQYLGWYDVKHDAAPGRDYIEALLDEQHVEFSYPGIDEALARVEGHIEASGPYNALLGFSQGAILITLLTALHLERARNGLGQPPSWQQNVLVCGMPVRANRFYSLFDRLGPLKFASTIAQGRDDMAYPWCIKLAQTYRSPCIIEYVDGHRFPHSKDDTCKIADSIRQGSRLLR